MKNLKHFLLAGCLVCPFVMGSCTSGAKEEEEAEKAPAIDLTAMDTSVDPTQDFYRYANGGWMKANPLKPEYGRYGTFDMLRDTAQSVVKRIIIDMTQEELPEGSDKYKAALLYKMVMDSTSLNAQGATPILPEVEELSKVSTKDELIDFIASQGNSGSSYLFGNYVYADSKNSDINILNLYQSGLIMGNRDYYLEEDADSKFHQGYKKYFTDLFGFIGVEQDKAAKMASDLLDVETSLAKIQYSNLELRDTHRNYNKRDRDTFFSSFTFPWKRYFDQRKGLENFEEINVEQWDYFKKFDQWFAKTPLEDIKLLILGKMLDGSTGLLSDNFREASFDFHGRIIGGKEEMQPRWKNAVGMVNGSMGHVVAQEYTKRYFPAEAKERMLVLVNNLKDALGERISELDWMSDETKEKAHEKLATFKVKVGYPDKWDTYEGIETDESSLYAYVQNINKYKIADNVKDLGKEVDKEEWLMNPHTVNAYYNPTTNEICFPAAILQPPFFNLYADDPVNYGGIGVVIGHEMTHGFDDQGRNYDKDGNLVNWWTEEDAKLFEASAKKLAEQYDKIIVVDDIHADGELTLGENIADQGGLLVSYMAMRNAIGDSQEEIDGFTPDQRFFIAYARLWGQNIRNEEIKRLTKMDVHSLGEWRVNQALKNIPAFYDAFDVEEGDAMYLAPEDRVLVW